MAEIIDRPLRVGIIGCGQIAQHHMKTWAKIPEAKMVAACDIIEERANAPAMNSASPTNTSSSASC